MDVGKLKTSIKRFFSNPNTLTFILVIGLIVVIYLVYSYMIGRAIAPVSIPYCTTQLKSSEEITSDAISSVEVSGNFVTANGSNLLQAQRNIRNQYVARGFSIPKNSFFYRDAVADSSTADVSLLADIPDEYTTYELKVDFHSTYGCSIMPGNYIDLYAAFNLKEGDGGEERTVYTWFYKALQVIKVNNEKGLDVFTEADDTDGKCNPSSLVFVLPIIDHEYLVKAENINGYAIQIIPVPRNAGYSENPGTPERNDKLIALIEANSSIKN